MIVWSGCFQAEFSLLAGQIRARFTIEGFEGLLMQRKTGRGGRRTARTRAKGRVRKKEREGERLDQIHALLEYNPCAEGSRAPLYYLRSSLLCTQSPAYNTPFSA